MSALCFCVSGYRCLLTSSGSQAATVKVLGPTVQFNASDGFRSEPTAETTAPHRRDHFQSTSIVGVATEVFELVHGKHEVRVLRKPSGMSRGCTQGLSMNSLYIMTKSVMVEPSSTKRIKRLLVWMRTRKVVRVGTACLSNRLHARATKPNRRSHADEGSAAHVG